MEVDEDSMPDNHGGEGVGLGVETTRYVVGWVVVLQDETVMDDVTLMPLAWRSVICEKSAYVGNLCM
jgi:hypothetical protein